MLIDISKEFPDHIQLMVPWKYQALFLLNLTSFRVYFFFEGNEDVIGNQIKNSVLLGTLFPLHI